MTPGLARLALGGALALGLAWALVPGAICAPAQQEASDGGQAGAASQDAGQLIDTFMAGEEQSVGVAVATSSDGAPGAVRLYGYADADLSEPVAEQTSFEWGRCSDIVVWACVMQLVEQGELSLDAEVEALLPDGAALPEGYSSVTVSDLMNHTTGLDASMEGLRSSIPDGTTSVVPAFSLFSVEEAFEPGDIVAYSPYDALLAAAVVEGLTGRDFADYAQENVLDRLGMDSTVLMVGGSPARLERAGGGRGALAAGRSAPAGTAASLTTSASGSAFSCYGPVGDLLALANGVMCSASCPWAFDSEETADELFEPTLNYPGLGIARAAHGLFAFPFSSGVFGMSASVSSGYSASVYMDRGSGLAVAILVGQAGRADIAQGVPRVLVGRSDGLVAKASTIAEGDWTGVYQDASSPNHGPAKLLTAFGRVRVSVGPRGGLLFNGLSTTSLGAGVYSVDTAEDQDVYRFHVSLERGAEFSRVASDSYVVPASTLALEAALLAAFALSWCLCAGYLAAGAWACLRRRRPRARRARPQPSLVLVSLATCAAGALAAAAAWRLSDGMSPAALRAIVFAEGAYATVAAAALAWVAATRLRGGASPWTRRQRLAAAAVCAAAMATLVNLVYWELLP